MKNKLIYTLLIGLFLLFTGCESNRNESKSISKMNIGDATTLFIASSANGMAEISPKGNNDAAVATKRLFKITEDGVVEDVVYTDEDGNEITETYIPENMYFIENSSYFFAEFRGDFEMKQYLVNKHTGAVYDASGVGVIDPYSLTESVFFANAPLFVTDGYGNIYYSSDDYNSGNDRVHKIDISNINQIVHEAITPITDNVDRFVSSTNGELFYEYYSDDSKYRLRSAGGKLIPFSLSADSDYDNIAFRGLDGKLHIFDRGCLQTVSFSDYGDITLDTIITNVLNTIYELGFSSADKPYLVTLENRILAIGRYSNALVLDSDNKDDITENVFDINDNMRISDLHYTDSYIYCCGEIEGNFSLVRIDPYTYSKDVIMQNNDYEIYSFTVLDDETIMFNGLRLSDGKNIIASIEKNGKFKILDETLNSQESVLERIQ